MVAALAAVMADVPVIGKDQAVTTGPARFRFRGVDDVMQAVGVALRKHRVVFAPTRVVSLEHERYDTAKGAPMDGVTVVVEYTITGPEGDAMIAAAAGQAADAGDKAVPKAMSVAYRTVLLQTLCIPTGDPDPDSSVHERAPHVDPVASLRGEIAKVGSLLGWTVQDIEGDFAQSHDGLGIRSATADVLALYLEKLRVLEGNR